MGIVLQDMNWSMFVMQVGVIKMAAEIVECQLKLFVKTEY